MEKREEIKEIIYEEYCNASETNNKYGAERAAERILAITDERVNKVREYCENLEEVTEQPTQTHYDQAFGRNEAKCHITSLLFENEKPFDIFKFLLSVGFKKNNEGHFVGENHTLIFDRHNWLNVLCNGTGLCFAGNHPKHDNRYLWINLLKCLIVIDEHEIQTRQ